MKWILTCFLLGVVQFRLLAQEDLNGKRLVGTWEFIELRDRDDRKVDTIQHPEFGGGYEIPSGPLTNYRADSTYSMQFTPKNTDRGTWYFDSGEQAIVHRLYYEKPYDFAAKDLIKKGHAIEDERGEYYEIILVRVIDLTDDQLIVMQRGMTARYRKVSK